MLFVHRGVWSNGHAWINQGLVRHGLAHHSRAAKVGRRVARVARAAKVAKVAKELAKAKAIEEKRTGVWHMRREVIS